MISLQELYTTTGAQLIYDADTGEQITPANVHDKGDREILQIRAAFIDGELSIKALVGRRRADRGTA